MVKLIVDITRVTDANKFRAGFSRAAEWSLPRRQE